MEKKIDSHFVLSEQPIPNQKHIFSWCFNICFLMPACKMLSHRFVVFFIFAWSFAFSRLPIFSRQHTHTPQTLKHNLILYRPIPFARLQDKAVYAKPSTVQQRWKIFFHLHQHFLHRWAPDLKVIMTKYILLRILLLGFIIQTFNFP